MEFPIATLWNFNLQLSVLLSYNKQALQRDVILLRYYKDYSDREISEKLKISRQAVNRAKNRGLKRLKELITL